VIGMQMRAQDGVNAIARKTRLRQMLEKISLKPGPRRSKRIEILVVTDAGVHNDSLGPRLHDKCLSKAAQSARFIDKVRIEPAQWPDGLRGRIG
jgi:hypothetical protein